MPGLELQPGMQVGKRYRLRQMIGAGAMGAVWSARDEVGKADVAIKFLHPSMLADPLLVQRFVLEADLAAKLDHPSIARVFGAGKIAASAASTEPTPYMVMELLDGETLDATIRRDGRLAPKVTLRLLREVAEGVHAAHLAGLIHRDLKPANIFLRRRGDGQVNPKILDFGVSKVVDPALDAGLTTTGYAVGSPPYMSPEQSAGSRDVDARSDVWSLGVVAYKCMTGTLPFHSNRMELLPHVIATADLDLEPLRLVDAPPHAIAIVTRCLAKDRADRFASARDLATALESSIAEFPVDSAAIARAPTPHPDARTDAGPPARAVRARPSLRTAAAAFGAIALVVMVVIGGVSSRSRASALPAPAAARPEPKTDDLDAPPLPLPLPSSALSALSAATGAPAMAATTSAPSRPDPPRAKPIAPLPKSKAVTVDPSRRPGF